MIGPLVVRVGWWGLPGGRSGALDGQTVAQVAADLGAPVAFVLDVPAPPDAVLFTPADEVVSMGDDGTGGPWRYRVTVPGRPPVTLVLVARDGGQWGGPWAGLSGAELCRVFGVVSHHLGVDWQHSTTRTAESLILATHPRRRGGRRLESTPEVPGPAVSSALELPWQSWRRPYGPAEAGAPWVHTFDANAMYLGTWQTVELGMGTPEHYATPRGCAPRVHLPGVWRVELPAGWTEDPRLPAIAPGLRREGAGAWVGWVMTPTLARLSQHAETTGQGQVTPEEGHVWPERSRYLRAAGERIRDLRAAALAAQRWATTALDSPEEDDAGVGEALAMAAVAGAVREAVRDLYTVTTGRLGSHKRHAAAPWRRPDWANTIRAEARANLHRKLTRWAAETDAAPFAVRTDALAFATPEEDPAAFAGWIGMRLGDGLGQFRHQGTAERRRVDEVSAARVFDEAANGS